MSAITIVPRRERLQRSELAVPATSPRFSSCAQCGRRDLPRPGAASAQTKLRIQSTFPQSSLIWESGKFWADRVPAIALTRYQARPFWHRYRHRRGLWRWRTSSKTLAISTEISQRRVGIESATCRWGRTGGPSSVTFG